MDQDKKQKAIEAAIEQIKKQTKDPEAVVRLGDEIAYHNSTTVDWLGTFAQGKYSTDKFSLYGMGGLSTIKYSYQDHFTVADSVINANAITTFQLKGGAVYNLDDRMSAFINAGYVQKPPILDNVISYDGTVSTDPDNEKFTSMEVGGEYNSGLVSIKGSYYNTQWKDRNLTKSVTTGQGDSGDTDIIYLTGVNQSHSGVEVETKVALHEMVDLDVAISNGVWKFDGDAKGDYQEMEYNEDGQIIGQTTTEYEYALDGLKVGDMPQFGLNFGLTASPVEGAAVQLTYRYYDLFFADWSPTSRSFSSESDADRGQPFRIPSYGLVDLNASYDLPFDFNGVTAQVVLNVRNLLDEVYIQDALDNSRYNAYPFRVNDHSANAAEVYLGMPTTYNLGLSIKF